MSLDYYYLISSLPTLKPEAASGWTPEGFLSLCAEHVNRVEMDILNNAGLENFLDAPATDTLRQWQNWEKGLRNRLASLRAKRMGVEAARFLRQEQGHAMDSRTIKDIQRAFEEPSPLKAESMLDDLRWSVLDALETGHYFDFDVLIIYYLKLQLIQKKSFRDPVRGRRVLESIFTKKT